MNFYRKISIHKNKSVALLFILIGFLFFLKPFIKFEKPIQIIPENTDKTKNWKLYSNQEYHFSFKYPEYLLSNFQIDSNIKSSKTLREIRETAQQNNVDSDKKKTSDYNVIFEADSWKSNDNLENFIKSNLSETNGLKHKKILFGNHTGIRISNDDTKNDVYFQYNFFKNGNFVYNFAILSDEAILIKGNQPLLEDIISTLKFN